MLLLLAEYLQQFYKGFAVFQYLSLRGILGVLTALTLSLCLGPWMIRTLQNRQIGQSVRNDGPQSHLSKSGTPTMGGALILSAITVSTLLWADLSNRYVWVVMIVTLLFGAIGWVDDYRKVIEKNSRGLPSRWKYFWQSVFGLGAAIFLYATAPSAVETTLILPILKDASIPLGIGFVVLTYFVIVGSSNAVNLTDGLDGLAIMPTVMVGGALGIFCYLSGNVKFADYLLIPYVPGAGELIVFCGALIGAGLGFLWFNTYPAQVFMGDVGALALGAALGTIAVIVRQEMLLSPLGGRAAQRFGATSMLLLFSFLSALALTAFGSYWVIVGAAAVLVLRALQLPLVTTLVAERNPGSMRVSALASNAVWRDIGAGLGPLLAGLLLPIASAPWVFGLAGAAIAVSAVFCWRAKISN